VEAAVAHRLNGGSGASKQDRDRPSGGLQNPTERARVLWEHSRALAAAGDNSSAAHYARDALALLDYADDRKDLDT
jgi:hypothetical protein